MYVAEKLNELYAKISDMEEDISCFYYSIIQLKKENLRFKDHKQSLYLDIKKFIGIYINWQTKKDYGYDIINCLKIINAINSIASFEERNSLLIYAYKELIKNNYSTEADAILKHIRKNRLSLLKNNFSYLKKYCYCFIHLISYNLLTVLICLITIFVLFYIITFPAPFDSWVCLKLYYNNFHDNYYLNHLLNLIAYMFNLTDNKIILPINVRGITLLSCIKIFYIIFIVNYLFQVILEQLKITK